MDVLEMIRAGMTRSVPFAQLTGIELMSVEPGRAIAQLVQRADVSNHIGTLHAGALFTLGETVSGAAMSGLFAEQLARLRPVATGATIGYLRSARGTVRAVATVDGDADGLRDTLAREGKVAFDAMVAITDEQAVEVASMTVGWQVRRT
ncbi:MULTISPECIES: DUF4442 domain-containing protein [unclassified Sphingomonas]|uniref:DUF4442 domain-containing protein n=1 Tax=unclassified Sphingomonas TaxID=196159 RepID=UPI000B30ACCE|nr:MULTISPECIES: DUF4442 domain-containing protein [unclassified Sphingomonas]